MTTNFDQRRLHAGGQMVFFPCLPDGGVFEEEAMLENEREDTRTYVVVVNHEEQYSIWFAERPLPLGWRSCEKTGTKQECLNYIKERWTDMRPLSVRQRMESVPG